MCVGTHGGQKGTSDSLELKLQAVVSFSAWVLGTESVSSGRIASALLEPFPQAPILN